jgi:hypothetical protein
LASKVKCVGVHVMKACGGVQLWIYWLVASDLDGSGQLHALAALAPKKEPFSSIE